MKTILIRCETEAERRAILAEMPTHASSTAMAVTALAQMALYGEPDPETGALEVVAPAIEVGGFWLLKADDDGSDPLALPEGVVAISPVFMGMA